MIQDRRILESKRKAEQVIKRLLLLILPLMLTSCDDTGSAQAPRILAIGDSMMAAHGISRRSIPNVVSESLGEPVVNRAVIGARIIYALPITGAVGFKIGKQYHGGQYDWVIANGGGNDIWLACGCTGCKRKLERLVSADAKSGEIPELVTRLQSSGGQVLWLGYLRTPGKDSPIESCAEEGDILESRLQKLAAERDGFHFLSMADLVPEGDLSYHGLDRIHPSIKGSAAIGKRAADYIRKVDPTR
jgi:lysophospholipase L1-like esterase